jgi:hypothetical protein
MVTPFHRSDYKKLVDEDGVMTELRKFNIPPGDYLVPCPGSPKAMKDPAFCEKLTKGPRVLMTIMPGGPITMGTQLAQWFVYCFVVGIFAAYVTGRALPSGADYLRVFRFAGTTAFIGYGLAQWQSAIWYKRSWLTTIKFQIDSLIYGLLTAGVFGWLWPR